MKKLLLALTVLWSVSAQAQKNTLLDQSFWQGKADVNAVKAEIEKGANPAQLNGMSFDPVVMAINAEAPNETIKFLLAQPGNVVTKPTHDGRIYLHWAASRGNEEIVGYLISKGSNISLKDSHGTSPLIFAASAGQPNTKIYDLFLAKGANLKTDLNGNGANALLLAIGNDKELKLTDYFISKGLDLKSTDATGTNAFGYAARAGNIDVLKALLQKGVSVDKNALISASEGGRRGSAPVEVFTYLEGLKVDPKAVNKEGRNVLHALVRRPNQNEIITHFLASGVDVNQADNDGNTPFMNAAATNRDTALLALLLPKVKNINQVNGKGLTPLAMAVNSNSSAVVNYLIAKGADVNSVDRDGNNIGYYLIQSFGGGEGGRGGFNQNAPSKAVEFGNKWNLLKAKGLNLSAPQPNGNTLYHLAVTKGELSLIKDLQPLQIDVNAKNKEGITALHKAAMVAKDDAIMKYLLSIGAKKDIKTGFDESAFDLASENETLKKENVSLSFLK
ncbi:ankyrin repeat domain-containing protein [Pedobacter rhizosphaerae]|uniref:Ankyrin repeat-containing protein n=1 Tax=Pedobacter rhizosphaerae TaxID=390241 RepID=A0A1H9QY85_9SPHI|nr:ankyrin repeat domain-containing protein [Pedobacter rhizosphaerae]SER65426.1 Ankyrin repeat-containing protein [Pedobacter rhizosphaerae]